MCDKFLLLIGNDVFALVIVKIGKFLFIIEIAIYLVLRTIGFHC